MEPERRGALAEQRVVKRAQRKRLALLLLVVLPQLEQHQLADGVDEIRRIERAALRFAPRAALLHERLLAEVAHALLDRHVLGVQLDADDEAHEANERFGELPELDARDPGGRSRPRSSSARSSAPSLRRTTPARTGSTCAPSTPPCADADSAGSARDRPRESRSTTASDSCSRAGARPAARPATTDRRRSGSSRRASACSRTGRAVHMLANDQR